MRQKRVIKRAEKEADYFIENKTNIREVASRFGVSKSTIHRDFTKVLPEVYLGKYLIVRKILDKNKEERTIRGGMANKKKWREKRKDE